MQTVLVLHSDPKLEPFLSRAFSPDFTFRDVSLENCKSEEQLMQVLAAQIRLADAVFVDMPSLQILGKWVLTWLRTRHPSQPAIVRIDPEQLKMSDLSPHWNFVFTSDPIERVRQLISDYLGAQQLRQELRHLRETMSRRAHAPAHTAPPPAAAIETNYQYREAFKNLSRLLGDGQDLKNLSEHAISLVREMFGVGKIAVFIRDRAADAFAALSGSAKGSCSLMASIGIPREMMQSFALSLEGGIGRYAGSQAKIVRRVPCNDDLLQPFEPQIEKEFEVMGTEFAVPILDRDRMLGVLTFSGKVTGEPFTNDELELVFNLMNQLGMMIQNIWLHQQISEQQSFMQDVMTHVHNGVVVIGSDSKIAGINRRAAELLGLKETGAVGADASWLPSQVADALFETLQSGETVLQREIPLPKT